jgi:preprotein translocase subunit SecE
MNETVENEAGALDIAKMTLAFLVLAGGIAAFYILGTQPLVVRWLIVLGALVLGALVAMQSQYGRNLWQFIQGSRIELRKVVWPTRQETMQTTIVVFVFVIVAGLFFFFLDMFLAWATKFLTGQGA